VNLWITKNVINEKMACECEFLEAKKNSKKEGKKFYSANCSRSNGPEMQ
jgi:hypothetical protein